MTSVLLKTIKFLAQSENPAALDLLRFLLEDTDPEVRRAAFDALYRKQDAAVRLELFVRFVKDEEQWNGQACITPDRLGKLSAEAFQSGDERMMQLAAQVIIRHKLYESVPTLCSYVESHMESWANLAADTILALSESFYDELLNCRTELDRRNMDRRREWLTGQIEVLVRTYATHDMLAVVKAYLIITKRDYPSFLAILGDIHSKISKTMVQLLEGGEHGSFIRLLLSFISDPESPALVDNILCSKDDPKFVRNFLNTVGSPPDQTTKAALKRFKNVKWLSLESPERLLELIREVEPCFVYFFTNITLSKEDQADLLRFVFKYCQPEARRVAVEALRGFPTEEFNQILIDAVQDPDAFVCASAMRIVKSKGLKDADQIIMRCVDRRESVVIQAIYDLLPDFHIETYLQKVEQFPEQIARTLGKIVRKIDSNTEKVLGEEIASFVPFRRLSAATAIRYLGLGGKFQNQVCQILERDEESNVRIAACMALSEVMTMEAIQALKEATQDRTFVIRAAANDAVQLWMGHYNRQRQNAD